MMKTLLALLGITFAIVVALAGLAIAALEDGPDDIQAEADMQRLQAMQLQVAATEQRLQRAASALCQADAGTDATARWTADGQLACALPAPAAVTVVQR